MAARAPSKSMKKKISTYLPTLRKRLVLSQSELAFLLRSSPAMLSKLERQERRPSASLLLGIEIIFGTTPSNAFPALHEEVEARIMRQASILYERLERKQDEKSREKCRQLLRMIRRLPPVDTDL